MKQWRPAYSIMLLAVSFVATRALALRSAGSLWFDEVFSVHFSSMSFADLWRFLQYEHNPLLHFVLLKGWMGLFGGSDLSVRLLSTLFGAIMVALVYLLGRRLYSERAGFFSALLCIASTLLLYHETEARMYAMEGALAAAFVFAAWMWRESAGSRGWLIAYTIIGVLLAHTHLTAWNLLLALGVYWVFEWRSGNLDARSIKEQILAHTVIAVSILPWFIPVLRNKLAAGHVSQGWFFAQSSDGYALSHLTNFLIGGETSLPLRVAAAGVLLFLLTASVLHIEKPHWWQRVASLWNRERWEFSLFLRLDASTRFLLTLIFVQSLTGFALQITVTKYLLPVVVPIFLLLGHGYESLASKHLRALIVVALIAIVAPMQVRLYTQPRHHWQEAAQQVSSWTQSDPNAAILVHSYAYVLPLNRYLNTRADQIIPFYPNQDDLTLDERVVRYNWQALVNEINVNKLEPLLVNKTDLIFVSSTTDASEQDPVKRWLWSHGWTLQDRVTYKGYGDPELLRLTRAR